MREHLKNLHFCRVRFDLEFLEPFTLQPAMLVRLRRELKRASGLLADDVCLHRQVTAMLEPDLPDDPYARRIFQKPSPPFVLQFLPAVDSVLDAGDLFHLEILFVGEHWIHVASFCALLRRLGRSGIYRGEGRFELVDLSASDPSGNRTRLPIPEDNEVVQSIPLIPFDWWLEEIVSAPGRLELNFITPTRLVSAQRPLFNPGFGEIFPFMLRRVTSMLASWFGVEPVDDPRDLIASAGRIAVNANGLEWRDWRSLEGIGQQQDFGGFIGTLVLENIPDDDLVAIVALASLFNIGKSATYGSGHYDLLRPG